MSPASAEHHKSDNPIHWVAGNIVAPAVNTALIEPVNALVAVADLGCQPLFGDRPIHKLNLLSVAEPTNPMDTTVQMAATGFAGTIPYMLAGELLGSGMRSVGERFGAEGITARALASQSVANVAAAGIYDLARDPYPSESRIGNAIGSMAAFSLFEGLDGRFAAYGRPYRYGAYFGIGAAGGASQYVIARLLAGQNVNEHDLVASALAGGAFNALMPAGQDATNRVANAIDARLHRSMPLNRYLATHDMLGRSPTLDSMAHNQPLARIMPDNTGLSWVDYKAGVIHAEADPQVIGHELDHLTTARSGATDLALSDVKLLLAKGDEAQAWADYRTMRAEQEISARQAEQQIHAELTGTRPQPQSLDIDKVASSPAAHGKTYEQVWREQFDHLKAQQSSGLETDFRR